MSNSSMLEIVSPYDRHLIREIPLASGKDAETILQESYELFLDSSNRLPKYSRMNILSRFRELLKQNAESMARQAAEEGGKPITDSRVEITRAINSVDIAMAELAQMRGTEIPMELTDAAKNHIAYTMIEPAGVVLAISAFNHPVNLIIHQVIPALAVGCPVIVKPAGSTPLSCLNIVELLYKAGLPEKWCRAIVCSNEIASKLASDHRIAFVTFIGSAKVGWNIRRNLAPGVRCALEHGGAAPAIIEPDVEIDNILPGLVKAGYYHAGQVCVSLQRLFVHKDIMDEASEKITAMVKKLKVGDPLDETTEVGPLILPREADRIDQWIKEAVKEGATLLAGGEKISDTCYKPTLLLNPSAASKVFSEEIFGPVVCLMEYNDRLEAIGLANSLKFSFQASIYTKSLEIALDSVKRLKAKSVMVNEHTAFRVDWMPFGGAEMSGLGTGGIGYSMRDMCSEKLMVIKSKVL